MLRRPCNPLFHNSPLFRRSKLFSIDDIYPRCSSSSSSSKLSVDAASESVSSSSSSSSSSASSILDQMITGLIAPQQVQAKRGVKSAPAPGGSGGFVKRRFVGVLRFAGFTAALTFASLSCFILSWPFFDAYLLPWVYQNAILYSSPTTNLNIAKNPGVFHPQPVVDHLCAVLFGNANQQQEAMNNSSSSSNSANVITEGETVGQQIEATRRLFREGQQEKRTDDENASSSSGDLEIRQDLTGLIERAENKGRIVFCSGPSESGKSLLVLQTFSQVESRLEEAKKKKENLKQLRQQQKENPETDLGIDEEEFQKRRYTTQPLLYISARGFTDSSTFLYTFMNNIILPNLGTWGGAYLSLQKLVHMTVDFLTMSTNPDYLCYLLFAQCMNHLRIGLSRIAELRRTNPEYESVRRPVIVIDSFERILDILTIHGKDSSLARFPQLMMSLLLRSSIDEGLCDVLILSDSRALHDGTGTSLKFTKLERNFPDLSTRATFVTLPPRTRHSGGYGVGQSNTDRLVSIMKAYHARPFLIRWILRELSEKGTCDIPYAVRHCYMEPDQIAECFTQLTRANITFPAAGPILGSNVKMHPRKYHYVSRKNFLPISELDAVDSMEVQFLKPRMGFWNYLLCAAFPFYGANTGVIPTTAPASNVSGGAVAEEGGKITDNSAGGGGLGGGGSTINNITVSLFPSLPEISNQLVYIDFAFSECDTEKSMLRKIIEVVGRELWLSVWPFGLQYLEDGELWVDMADLDDLYAIRNCDQLRPRPAPAWLRDLISIGFWSGVGLLCYLRNTNV